MTKIVFICTFFLSFSAAAQVAFHVFPKDKSMTARDLLSNKGLVTFDFSMSNNQQPDSIIWKKFEDGHLIFEKTPSYFLQNNNFHFFYHDTLKAALHEYEYEIWYGNNLLKRASGVCCGDFYIINGQSNAESKMQGESCANDYHPFVRTFGNASEKQLIMDWAMATGDGNASNIGHIGQLGIAIGKNLVTKLQVPVCILNGATGGKEINYFLKNEMNPTSSESNYGRLLSRAKETGAIDKIRAIIWYQGENDAYAGNSYGHYLARMESLYYSWKMDYQNIERIYLVQIKQGCKQNMMATGEIQQAQIDFSEGHSDVSILSTANLAHYIDNCHFNYQNGYKVIGKKLSNLIEHFQYGTDDTDGIFSAAVIGAARINPTCLDLKIKNSKGLFPEKEILKDFYLNQSKQNPIDLKADSGSLQLFFQNPIPIGESLSYIGHTGLPLSSGTDTLNQGLLCFYQMKIDFLINEGKDVLLNNELVLSRNATASVFCHVSRGFLQINSNYKTNLKGTYHLYDNNGTLIRRENIMIFEGKNTFNLELLSAKANIVRIDIATPKGLITEHIKCLY